MKFHPWVISLWSRSLSSCERLVYVCVCVCVCVRERERECMCVCFIFFFRSRICTVRLSWAGDNLGEWDEFCWESWFVKEVVPWHYSWIIQFMILVSIPVIYVFILKIRIQQTGFIAWETKIVREKIQVYFLASSYCKFFL